MNIGGSERSVNIDLSTGFFNALGYSTKCLLKNFKPLRSYFPFAGSTFLQPDSAEAQQRPGAGAGAAGLGPDGREEAATAVDDGR